ncbi:hypothetical protein [Xenorhabdus hominickii]|uniref:Tail protein n=1 Tax=Xenorhabdus hominickii TaxID=351679 RepID=A0A2G0QB87_XENHO|nr:hypothetical protein A9255_08235 [Xenorhabdus hominickii]PHM56476.1 tail protein [Xenorhabdus hominickii]
MSIINKPDYKIFANDAKAGELETFPDLLRGWGMTIDRTAGKPPMEWFNALGKRTDEWMMYLSQRGLPEWDVAVDYPQYAVVQHEGKFYTAKKQTRGQRPDQSQNEWMLLADAIGIAKSVTDALNAVTDNANSRLAKGQNGADILDKPAFVNNLGLQETVRNAERLIGLPTGETRLLSGNSSTYLYVTDNNRTGSYNTQGGHVWSFDDTGTLETGLIPIQCGGTGARTANEALATLGAVPGNRTINGQSLTADIQLTAADVRAYPADGRLINLPSGETRLASGNGSTYLYVTDDHHAGSYNTRGGHVWAFDGAGKMTTGLIPVQCGGTGARTAEEGLAALGGLPSNRSCIK